MLEFFALVIMQPIANGVLEFQRGNFLVALMMMLMPTAIIMSITVGGSYIIHQFLYHFGWREVLKNGRTYLNRLLSKMKRRRTIFEVRVRTPGLMHVCDIQIRVKGYIVLPVGSAVHLHDKNGRNILYSGTITDHLIYNYDGHNPKTLYVVIESNEEHAKRLIETSRAPERKLGPMRYPRTIHL
jgi:hypothetical protein